MPASLGNPEMPRTSDRRRFLRGSAAAAAAALMPLPAIAQGVGPTIIVIGGGFAGATCARELKRIEPKLRVVVVEANPTFTACPFSNAVIAGLRELRAQQFNYEALGGMGIVLAFLSATKIDPRARAI